MPLGVAPRARDARQRGFTRRNLLSVRQFDETYSADKKVTALLTQLLWTHNLIILTQSKRPEKRAFSAHGGAGELKEPRAWAPAAEAKSVAVAVAAGPARRKKGGPA